MTDFHQEQKSQEYISRFHLFDKDRLPYIE